MKTAGKIMLLAVMITLAFSAAWGAAGTIRRAEERIPAEVYALYQAKSGRAQYLLREKEGFIAVFRSGENRPERLTNFKRSFGASLDTVERLIHQYLPEADDAWRQRFIYAFFPFIYGIYPYTSVTEKQEQAMRDAGIPYVYQSAYDLTFSFLNQLLKE